MIRGIRRINHVAISTPDLKRAVTFYRDVLGFEETERFAWEAGSESADLVTGLKDSAAQAVLLRLGEIDLELFQYESPRPRSADGDRPVCDHGITHIALDVEGIDAVHQALIAEGMRFHSTPQPTGDGMRSAYGRDPDGNVIEIQEIFG